MCSRDAECQWCADANKFALDGPWLPDLTWRVCCVSRSRQEHVWQHDDVLSRPQRPCAADEGSGGIDIQRHSQPAQSVMHSLPLLLLSLSA